MPEYHQVGDKYVSDRGKFYMDKRERAPKEGPREYIKESEQSYSENYGRIFGTPVCEVCGVEVLRGRSYCDKHKDGKNGRKKKSSKQS